MNEQNDFDSRSACFYFEIWFQCSASSALFLFMSITSSQHATEVLLVCQHTCATAALTVAQAVDHVYRQYIGNNSTTGVTAMFAVKSKQKTNQQHLT